MFGRKKKEIDPETYIKNKQAEMTNLIKSAFESAGWDYTFKTESNTIVSGFMGDDLPIHIGIIVREISLHFVCPLDFVAEPDKFKEVCWALNEINKGLMFGAFYLNSEDGQISFEYGLPFVETNFSKETLASIIKLIVETVDKHDGDLEKIAKKAPVADGNNPMFG